MVVQIIKEKEKEPGFARQLLGGLAKASAYGAEAIPDLIQKNRTNKAEEEYFNKKTGLSGKNLSPEYRKLILEQEFKREDLLRKGEQEKQLQERKEKEQLRKEEAKKEEQVRKEALAKEEKLRKEQMDMQAKQEEMQSYQNGFNALEALIPYTGSQLPFFKSSTFGGLNREAVEKREQFKTLGFWITDKIFTHFNKGVVSTPKFDEIKNNLSPRADLSERQNRGRINSLKTILNLPSDISSKEFDKIVDGEMKKLNKIPERAPSKLLSENKEKPPLSNFWTK